MQFVLRILLLRNFYCGDAHHANYGKHSFNHHFQHCAHSVSEIESVLKLFKITVCFTHFGFYEISTPVVRSMLTKAKWFKSSFPTLRTQCISDLQRFEIFRNSSFFSTSWLLRNFYSCDAHHANYGKHSLNNHFQQCAHSVYEIYSVLNLFKIAVFFAHICLYEISTLVMRIMLTMANIVLIIISNIAHTVYIRLKAFWNFSKLQFVLHIFYLLENFYSGDAHHANHGKHSLNHHLEHCAHSVYQIYSVLKLFKITVCFTHFRFYEISTPVVRIMLTKAK